MIFKDAFINCCVGVITAASCGTFATVYEMKTAIAVAQEDLTRTKADVARIDSAMEKLRDELANNTIEVVRVRAQCEKIWNNR